MNTIIYPERFVCPNHNGAAEIILPQQKNNLFHLHLKILSLFLAALLFIASSASGQGPCPGANCNSGDIRITKVELLRADGTPLPNTCPPGGSIAVKLRVTFDVTSSERYGFLVNAGIYINNSLSGTIATCDPATFSQGLHTMDISQYVNGNPILWPCGSTIQLKDVYTAWDQQVATLQHPGICTYLNPSTGAVSDCSSIAPKCKFYGENEPLFIALPLISSFTATEGTCNGLKRSWTFTSTTTGGTTPYTYTWNFGDGSPVLVTTQNPVTHDYAYGVGNVNVTLSVEDASTPTHQTSTTQPQAISVTSCCVASTNPTGASAVSPSICLGGNTNISVVGGSLGTGASWKWYAGGCGTGTSIGTGATINVNPATTTTYYVRAEGDCGTTACASVQVVVNPTSVGGTLAESKTICAGSNSGLLSLTGNVGSVQRWESSTTSAVAGFSTIGATAGLTSYTSGALTQDTWFRVVVKSGVCTETNSPSVKITVQQPISNNTIAASQTICSGNTAAGLTGSTPTGGDGSYSYQWQSRSGGGWSNIASATSKNYAPGAISEYTQFKRIVTAGSACSNSTSAVITISISPESQVYAIQGSNFCQSNPNSGTITLSGSYPGVSYQMKSSDNSAVQDPQTGTGSALTWIGLATGSYYVYGTGIAPTYCTSQTATVNVIMFDCSVFYTLTQGYYGGKNGKSCIGTNPVNTIKYLLGSVDLVTGTNNSVTVPATNDGAIKLNQTMPGGNTPNGLPAGNCIITTGCFVSPTYLTQQGRINNILLSQTITLGLNVRWDNSKLLLFPIKSGYLTTQKMKGCGESAVLVTTCESGTISSILMNQNVVNYLGGSATVADLLQLANDVLGGSKVPGVDGVPSYADVNEAVDCINKSFDEGRRLLNYYDTKQTCELLFPPPIILPTTTTITSARIADASTTFEVTVTAYPNPFSDNINFQIETKQSGQGSLEVYNMAGQKVKTVFSGYLNAGTQRLKMNVPTNQRSVLFYIFRMGDQKAAGKILHNGNY